MSSLTLRVAQLSIPEESTFELHKGASGSELFRPMFHRSSGLEDLQNSQDWLAVSQHVQRIGNLFGATVTI